LRIILVPFTFLPDPIGGTEVYVIGLARGLIELGWEVLIAAPGARNETYQIEGLDVERFSGTARPEGAHGTPDELAAHNFGQICLKFQPDVVHLHAHTAAVSHLLFDVAKAHYAKTVFTYHTPTVSCARGTMMYQGQSPCHGRIEVTQCTSCVLQKHDLPGWIGRTLARVPFSAGAAMGRAGVHKGPLLALRMRQLIQLGQERFTALLTKADHVVGVCDWVGAVLLANGLSKTRLTISRQGTNLSKLDPETIPCTVNDRPLRVAYFGRLDPTKGVHNLIDALIAAPSLAVQLTIYGIEVSPNDAFGQRLAKTCTGDNRIAFHGAVSPDLVTKEMAKHDVIAVPSTWLETGPLVVLEAFRAGVVVLGSNLGGIAELVSDGTNGLLVEAGDVGAWRNAMTLLASNRGLLAKLKMGIVPPRSVNDVTNDMHALYEDLIIRR